MQVDKLSAQRLKENDNVYIQVESEEEEASSSIANDNQVQMTRKSVLKKESGRDDSTNKFAVPDSITNLSRVNADMQMTQFLPATTN